MTDLPNRRTTTAATMVALALLPGAVAQAADFGQFDVTLDARAIASDARPGFMNGGFGKLRFDEDDDGIALGRLRLAWQRNLGESWRIQVDASAWGEDEDSFVDLTEVFVEWRPVPQSAWRQRAQVGAFFPPVSLEHRDAGWSNPYFRNSSALNSWIGEELRTIGVEYRLEYSGVERGSEIDWGGGVAVHGWNDPAGVLVGTRGFALHDRQTPLFGRTPTVPLLGPVRRVIFEEIDDRAGYYVHGFMRQADRLELRALWYDNRADSGQFDSGIGDFAWGTKFLSAGARYETEGQTTFIAQWLNGRTSVGPAERERWTFDAAFLLVAQQIGAHRLAARADVFSMDHVRTLFAVPLGRERGDAWAMSWSWQASDALEVSAEWLEVDSDLNWRWRIGEEPEARERSLQLGLRYSWSSGG